VVERKWIEAAGQGVCRSAVDSWMQQERELALEEVALVLGPTETGLH
jgi:hypothetical protein